MIEFNTNVTRTWGLHVPHNMRHYKHINHRHIAEILPIRVKHKTINQSIYKSIT